MRSTRSRAAGHYISRCTIPADLLNEGRFVLGVNASSFRVKRYFQDEQALTFTVDAAGAPGMQWPEPRLGPIRPGSTGRSRRLGNEFDPEKHAIKDILNGIPYAPDLYWRIRGKELSAGSDFRWNTCAGNCLASPHK